MVSATTYSLLLHLVCWLARRAEVLLTVVLSICVISYSSYIGNRRGSQERLKTSFGLASIPTQELSSAFNDRPYPAVKICRAQGPHRAYHTSKRRDCCRAVALPLLLLLQYVYTRFVSSDMHFTGFEMVMIVRCVSKIYS